MNSKPAMLQPASFIPLHCALEDLTIKVDPADPPAPTPAMLERWSRACSANPRLFNGPILRFMAFEKAGGGHSGPHVSKTRTGAGHSGPHVISARNDTYQRYAMQAHTPTDADPATDIYHLAVTGVVTTHDTHRNKSVLLGKRGASTFVYPTMWEHAPGGGLETADIYEQLLREMEEELNLPGLVDGSTRDAHLEPPHNNDVLGLAIDPNTPSVDVVVRLRLCKGAERALGSPSWEYGATRFIPVTELATFAEREGRHTIIPPALAIWRGLGWP